jgi:FkbM family methyltransferase
MHPILGHYIAQHRNSKLIRFVAKRCQNFLGYYENRNWNFQSNGERYVLQQLAPFDFSTVFDVGANVGDWSQLAQEIFPDATIYAFEIIPEIATRLHERFSTRGNIRVQSFGLAEKPDEVTVETSPTKTTVSSMVRRPSGEQTIPLQALVRTGDSFSKEENIENIDFLKIDVEGAEDRVLKGFSEMLSRQKITIIQFEYGKNNIYSRFLLRDYYLYLEPQGYCIGKIFPRHVEFKEYSPWDENFMLSNFVAVQQTRSDVIECLKG